MTRKQQVRLVLAFLLGLASAGVARGKKIRNVRATANPPQYVAFSKSLPKEERFHQALERLTLGPRPGDLDSVRAVGLDRFVDEELHPERVPENPQLLKRLAPLETLQMSTRDIYVHYPDRQVIRQVVASDLVEGKLLRAIYGNHQLEELMVDFWYNHFNVFLNKGRERYLVTAYERESIRPYVFGKFKDLLLATAKSPAMLLYLDNAESVAPQLPNSQSQLIPKKLVGRGLNENYGRELLELHTLGVDGGYTQSDVIAVARCFTGWTLSGPRQGNEFQFNDKVHDHGAKVVLGVRIAPGGGISDGLRVINILAHQAATARFISLRLAQRFVADDPPPSLVNRMAETFERSDGDIREAMRTMLKSPEFWSQGAYQAKMKSPFEMIVSAVRAADAEVTSAFALGNAIQKLGEPLYRKIEPTGYSSANAEWVSSAALLDRMNFALALAHNQVVGVIVNVDRWTAMSAPDPMQLARYLLGQDPTQQTRRAIEKALSDEELRNQLVANAKAGSPQQSSVIAGLVLGSPEFQRR